MEGRRLSPDCAPLPAEVEVKRRTPLARRSARSKVKHPERVRHGRIKRRITDMNALEEKHMERLLGEPCCVTGQRQIERHHLMKAPAKRCRRDHKWVVPLIPKLHQNWSPISVHGLGTEAKFEAFHDLPDGFLITVAEREWNVSEALYG
jgi:hypothetical protein